MSYSIERQSMYETRLENFYKKNKDKTEKDFIELKLRETEKRYNINKYKILSDYIKEIEEKHPFEEEKNITIDVYNKNVKLRAEYYKGNIDRGLEKNYKEDKEFYELKLRRINETLNKDELQDLSSTNATEKIIYLHELGVLTFLYNQPPFNTSVNGLATVLSAITGAKVSTIQPYINPILNPKVEQEKNPYSTEKTVQKVKNRLIHLGFKPK